MCILLFKRLRKLIERSVQLTSSTLSSASVHRRRKGSVVGGTMASAEHEPILGVWGQKPPEAVSILVIGGCPTELANLAPLVKFSKYSCNVHLKNQSTAMKGTGAKRNVCPGSCVSTGAKFPVAPVQSAPTNQIAPKLAEIVWATWPHEKLPCAVIDSWQGQDTRTGSPPAAA